MLSNTETETLFKAIAHRRSMGLSRVSDAPVPRQVVEQMLEAANWGQSNDDTEPWRFQVFQGEARTALAEMYAAAYRADVEEVGGQIDPVAEQGYADRAFQAPLWIAIGVDPQPDAAPHEELMAVATAVQNMSLIASALGLAGMWHSKGVSIHPAVAERLGWTEPKRLLGFFFAGPANCEWPVGERKPLAEKVNWV